MVLSFFKTLLFDWVTAFRDLKARFKDVKTIWKRRKHHGKVPTPERCVPLDNPAFVRPDPMIYDQYFLISLGLDVTWDNPDIQLFLNGAPVSSSDLLAGTTYDVVAQIWNNSTDAPVVGLPVAFSFLDFGVGTVSVPIGSTTVDLGVKGGPNCPAFAHMSWTTPTTPGHYCVQVLLQPADDSNAQNNLGQENTNVGVAHSPAVFTWTLRNVTDAKQTYRFETDAYVLGTPDQCDANSGSDAARRARLARHRRGTHPVPAGWTVTVNPATPTLDPGQEIAITVSATPPPGFTGEQPLNVNAFHSKGLAGGVTLTVRHA
ncbi:MAG TPA: hypothetical protein VJN96_22280 [Vicinamibacterales bacterium]|nr:hypothetical protein [Vicinamibacterales bacterium]